MNEEYILNYYEEYTDVYKGTDEEGFEFIAIKSKDVSFSGFSQKTKELIFKYNVDCFITIDGERQESKLHILTCSSHEKNHIINFERLISAFLKTEQYNYSEKIIDLFSTFLSMFSSPKRRSYEELEGFFSELYFIYYMRNHNYDIARFWQSKDKMKFDFSFDDKRRLDVKCTSRLNRIHHFKHEQLASDLYDIRIVSFLNRKADKGLSINDLIVKLRELGELPLSCEKLIQSFISNTENTIDLDELKFDEQYLLANIKIYNALDIPKFNGKQPNGVTKTEYDSDLSLAESILLSQLIEWLKEII